MTARLKPDEVPPGAITFWVIYDHPKDFPDSFVLRPQFSCMATPDVERYGVVTERVGSSTAAAVTVASHRLWVAPTLAGAQALVPPGCYHYGRQPGDDAKIADVWMQ